ncbi:hypothetical protein [endosymbiont of unidentified scaly snail isolate Monju]|uniref:hypothetical protein n=1 Tax=endosymbiont of unidentified scaly snail isolate Monju TaxID=1248727 RepID=UPI0011DE359A|nr:hypothetical protein [endosymbiont of unidentified scaly snail isolate Monju]
MFKKSLLGSAVALAIALPNIATAEVETSVILKNETAVFFKQGIRTGEATSTLDPRQQGGRAQDRQVRELRQDLLQR